ncbi:RNA polymerase III [Babesia caballi]|uniref:RNA polymerase III n=1 Tax=Babesia caballi TaxID=5871 RepID=A0AAV4LYY2_BABCB|nr:RNA polymerase III [Babesia caballi]
MILCLSATHLALGEVHVHRHHWRVFLQGVLYQEPEPLVGVGLLLLHAELHRRAEPGGELLLRHGEKHRLVLDPLAQLRLLGARLRVGYQLDGEHVDAVRDQVRHRAGRPPQGQAAAGDHHRHQLGHRERRPGHRLHVIVDRLHGGLQLLQGALELDRNLLLDVAELNTRAVFDVVGVHNRPPAVIHYHARHAAAHRVRSLDRRDLEVHREIPHGVDGRVWRKAERHHLQHLRHEDRELLDLLRELLPHPRHLVALAVDQDDVGHRELANELLGLVVVRVRAEGYLLHGALALDALVPDVHHFGVAPQLVRQRPLHSVPRDHHAVPAVRGDFFEYLQGRAPLQHPRRGHDHARPVRVHVRHDVAERPGVLDELEVEGVEPVVHALH